MMEMGRRKWVWTDLPPRMKARKLASGKVLYYYQAGGKQIPLGANRISALEEWARLEAGGTKAALFPRITAIYRKSPAFTALAHSTRQHYVIALDNLDRAFKAFRLEQIEPKNVKDYIRKRSKKGAALFEKRVGSAFFNWAREEGHTNVDNPFRGVKFSRAESRGHPGGRRKVYVTDEQYRDVWKRGDEILQDAMDLALHTGQRPGDILKARRQDIEEVAIDGRPARVLWIVQEKTGEKVGISIEGELERVLQRVLSRERPVSSLYLIADRRGQRVLYNALNVRFRKARGNAAWQFRDIRAKTASDMPDLKKAQLLLGHAAETTTNIYRRARGTVVAPMNRKI